MMRMRIRHPLYRTLSSIAVFLCGYILSSSVGTSISACRHTIFSTTSSRTGAGSLLPSAPPPSSSWLDPQRQVTKTTTTTRSIQSLEILRGGAAAEDVTDDDDKQSDEEDDIESDSESESDVEEQSSASVAKTGENDTGSRGMASLEMVQKVLAKVGRLLYRVVQAAFESNLSDHDQGEATPSILTRIVNTISRMFQAAFSSSSEDDDSAQGQLERRHQSDHEEDDEDFGRILAQTYQIQAGRYSSDDDDDETKMKDRYRPILTGSFMDAMKNARSQARLLVVLIPAEKPSRKSAADVAALQSFLSREVAAVAEAKARKTKKQQGEAGKFASFLLWSANAGSTEAAMAVKRLNAQTVNKRVPILLVAYLKPGIDKQTGTVRLVPRLLAQHHCSPPPPPETMAAWLNALRKRHAKQYIEMQTLLQELEYARQRQEGYQSSVSSDTAQRAKELREAAQRQAQEAAAKKHEESILARRVELRKTQPPEPNADMPTVKTIALRLPNGQSAQRRFLPDTKLGTLFNWVDADFEMEREMVILTTLNGQQAFSWQVDNDKTLADAGLAQMTGLRVTTQKKKEPEKSKETI